MKELSKLTDRFVPRLINFKDLESLLCQFAAQLKIVDGVVHLIKSVEEEGEGKIDIQMRVMAYDEDTDCLQFQIK